MFARYRATCWSASFAKMNSKVKTPKPAVVSRSSFFQLTCINLAKLVSSNKAETVAKAINTSSSIFTLSSSNN